VPNSPQNTIESALGADLAPLGSTTGEYRTPIEEPGSYLVTVEIRTPEGEIIEAATVDLSVE
ncbi:MAG: hypothetical protein LC772_05625, partial [Chloroflexi bacterium]|nr:hypothetical protein [Chloroflexota bacterium]